MNIAYPSYMRSAFFRDIAEIEKRCAFVAFQRWFGAAAVYNLVWGSTTLLFPQAFFKASRILRIEDFYRAVLLILCARQTTISPRHKLAGAALR